jgi:hypothetical protein
VSWGPKAVPKQESTLSAGGAKWEHDNSSGGSGGKWVFGIIGIVLVIWLINDGSQTNEQPSYTVPTYSKPQSSPTPTTKTPSSNQSINLSYIMPPVGTNTVLSVAQIRWCLRESIRIDAMRDVIDTHEGTDVLNSIINNFNDRCGSYRYRQGTQARAESDVEPNRSNIVTAAIIEAREISPSELFSTAPPPSQTSTKPNAQLTKEVQQLLTSLGYDPGPVDGDYGRRTADAVKAFQRDADITQDGLIDQDLLTALRRLAAQRFSLLLPKADS